MHAEDDPLPRHPGIRIDKIPVDGPMGLIFTIASLVIFLALPVVRWFAILSVLPGLAIGVVLHWLHRK